MFVYEEETQIYTDQCIAKVPKGVYRDEDDAAWIVFLNGRRLVFKDRDAQDSPYKSLNLVKRLLAHHTFIHSAQTQSIFINQIVLLPKEREFKLVGKTYNEQIITSAPIVMYRFLNEEKGLIECIDLESQCFSLFITDPLRELLNTLA